MDILQDKNEACSVEQEKFACMSGDGFFDKVISLCYNAKIVLQSKILGHQRLR